MGRKISEEIIKQVNYRVSDRFYKLASQRLMAFIDTTTPEGAKTIYNGKNPIYKLFGIIIGKTK